MALAVALPVVSWAQTPSAKISTSTVHFGATVPNMPSGPGYVFVTNNGTVPLSITGADILGDSSFAVTNGCPGVLATSHTCTLTIIFTPTGVGELTATLQINDNAPNSPQTVAISGQGEYPTVYLSNKTWTFGATAPGVQVGPGYIFVTNSTPAKAPLQITSIQIVDPTNSVTQTNNCPAILGGAVTCNISLFFEPTVTGVITASLVITDDSPSSPQTVSIQGVGSGPAAVVSTPSWDFGPTTLGQQPQGTIYLTNTGNAILSISNITLTGTYYSQTGTTCGTTLGSYTACSVTFTFAPTTTGVWTGTLTFTDDALPAVQSVSISGWAIPPSS